MTLYHNPRCAKSRAARNLLTEEGVDFETVEYLKEPLAKEELSALLAKLGITAEELVRKGEADYKAHFKGQELSEEQWIEAMLKFPKLMERPIVVKDDKAVVGRPIENVIALLRE